jgi:hypothetical protein
MEWKVSRESLITMGWLPTGQTETKTIYDHQATTTKDPSTSKHEALSSNPSAAKINK